MLSLSDLWDEGYLQQWEKHLGQVMRSTELNSLNHTFKCYKGIGLS